MCREMCQRCMVTNEGARKKVCRRSWSKFCDVVALRGKLKMANRYGEYCFLMVMFVCEFLCILKSVNAVDHLDA